MYIYPANLKAQASILFWTLQDLVAAVLLSVLGVLLVNQTGSLFLLAVAAAFAFLSIRFEETSILDFIRYAWRHCVSCQQIYFWRWPT